MPALFISACNVVACQLTLTAWAGVFLANGLLAAQTSGTATSLCNNSEQIICIQQ